jgi:hypothetical protein
MGKYNFSKNIYVIIYYKHTPLHSTPLHSAPQPTLRNKLKMMIQRHPVVTIINISILAIILTYVQAMKVKCGYCTNIPETKYVTFLTSVILIQVLAVVIFPTQVRNFFMNNMWLILVLIVANIANIIFLYQFIQKMKSVQCNQCTSEWRRSFLYYYSSFVLILYAINIVLSIMAVLILSVSYNPRSQIVSKSLLKRGRK